MKTKYLFYSLALAGTFAACTQEELIESPVADNAANRQIAGVVEFSTDGVESRYNHETTLWDNGDVFGLYLMDEYISSYTGCGAADVACPGEHNNANQYVTKKLDGVVDDVNGYSLWAYQDHWFGMYRFTNSIQSNYPFRATVNGEKVTWKNDAKLVEGNYFAMYPQNDKALNRRELWHEIDPSITLKKHSRYDIDRDKYFVNMDNQFFLGYKQIRRNETSSAEGVMKMNVDLKGAMVPVHLRVRGWSDTRVKLDKIEFKSAAGNVMPTIAYIQPEYNDGNWTKNAKKADGSPYYYEKKACSNGMHGVGLYSESKTWTRATIQNLVSWSNDTERIPYGSTGRPAYAYSIEFPGDFDNKVILEDEKTDVVNVYFALPAFWGDVNYKDDTIIAEIYGWQWIAEDNNGKGRWEYGVLTSGVDNDDDFASMFNKSFDLDGDDLASWINSDGAKYFLTIETDYDNYGWVPVNQAIVSSTEDMTKMIEGAVLNAQSGSVVNVTVQPDQNGVEVKASLITWLKEQVKGYKQINITFDGTRGGKVYFNENETMAINTANLESGHNLKFNYTEGIELINNAVQNITNVFDGFDQAQIINNQTINLINGTVDAASTIINNGILSISTSTTNARVNGGITNYATLTLNKNAYAKSILNAGGKTIVAGNSTVHTFINENGTKDCQTCVGELEVNATLSAGFETNNNVFFENKKDASVVVSANGYLHAYAVNNAGSVLNKGTLDFYYFNNKKTLNNEGTITTLAGGAQTLDNYDLINNSGKITAATLQNNPNAVINEMGGYISALKNVKGDEENVSGILNVYSVDSHVKTLNGTEGYIIFKGVPATKIGTITGDTRIFEVTADDETLVSLMEKMQPTASSVLRTSKNITLNWDTKKADILNYKEKIEKIYVDGADVLIKAEAQNKTYAFNAATLEVKKNNPAKNLYYNLTVDGVVTLKVKDIEDDSKSRIDVTSNSKIEASTGEHIVHTSNN